MSEPIKPVLKKNFFTAEEYGDIYEVVVRTMQRGLDEAKDKYAYMAKLTNNGFIVLFENDSIRFPDSIHSKARIEMEKLVDGAEMEDPGILFARYTKDSGAIPTLMPHCDRATPKTSIAITIPLDQTLQWDIYVKDEKFKIQKNDALFMSGSHDPHWRPDLAFGDEDYYDILLIQSYQVHDHDLLTEEFRDNMDRLCGMYMHKYSEELAHSLLKVYDSDGCQ